MTPFILKNLAFWDTQYYETYICIFRINMYFGTPYILGHFAFWHTFCSRTPCIWKTPCILKRGVSCIWNTTFNGTPCTLKKKLFFWDTIFIIYICLKQNYIKQYKSLQFNTNTLFSGYRNLWLTGFAKKQVPSRLLAWV